MRSTPWCVSRAAPHYPCVARARPQAFGRPAALDAADAEQNPLLPRLTDITGQRRPASSRSWCSPMRAPSQQRFNCREGRERRSPDATGRAASPGSAATADRRAAQGHGGNRAGQRSGRGHGKGHGLVPAGDPPDRPGGLPGPPDLGQQGMLGRAVQKAPVDREGADDQGRGLPPPRGPQTPVNGHKILGQRRLHASDAALYSHRTTGGTASGRIPPRDRDAGAAYGPASRTIAARKV